MLNLARERAPDHHPRQGVAVRFGGIDRGDDLAAPHDRNAVGDGHYLVELVRNEDDAVTARRQTTQSLDQSRGFLRGEYSSWLVEHQDSRSSMEQAKNL